MALWQKGNWTTDLVLISGPVHCHMCFCVYPLITQLLIYFNSRAGLKPMQPTQLYWAPRFWGPRAVVFRQVVHFSQNRLALESSAETVCKLHCEQTMLPFEQTKNFLLLLSNIITRTQYCRGRTLFQRDALNHVVFFVDDALLLVVPIRTAIDLLLFRPIATGGTAPQILLWPEKCVLKV